MRIIQGANNVDTLLKMYDAVKSGFPMETRGQKCRNVMNLAVMLDGLRCPITDFEDRKMNVPYAKKEWLWYVGADPKDDSIEQHATMWKKLKQPDGSYYSNYGQYLFGPDLPSSQFAYVIKCLREDRNSRRASFTLLKREHLFLENTDTVCTYAINFTIFKNQLEMTVMMRSNDVIYGFTNDAFCFWNLMACVYAVLRDTYPELKMGNYVHFANSMHVYERHYDMINAIVRGGGSKYRSHSVPLPTKDEALQFLNSKGKDGNGPYCDWIRA